MKLKRGFWMRLVPILVIVVTTVAMSLIIYQKMIKKEEEICWERLEIATKSTAGKINVRINDNISFLESVSESFVLTQKLNDVEIVGEYLNSVMSRTIFERIDVLLPNEVMITHNGEAISVKGDLSYNELLNKGSHVSPRCTNPFSGEEVIYCFTAIKVDNEVKGLLIGTIDCKILGEIFEVFTYGKDSQLFLIDCTDGKYLIDTWHEKIDNIYNLGTRVSIDGKEKIDMVSDIINRKTGKLTYISETNGENSYQYYTPVEDFNWELCVVVQEDIVFENVDDLRKILATVGVVEFILLFMFVVWNFILNLLLTKNEIKTKKLEMNKATNEARSKFISNMSHDIRTPLNGIAGMLQIIKTHRQDEAVIDDCLKKIEISTQYLVTLASDMLDINEIESDKLIFDYESIDLKRLADDLSTMIEIKAKEANVEYYMDYSNLDNPYVMGSIVHIERILVNLIGNAIKYSKETDGKVWVSIEDSENENDTYKFIVRDNGIGMTEEFQKNMYKAFAQEKVGARSQYQGYGLGLTIVDQLVKKMGGNIQIDSKKGEGTTFTITLILNKANKEDCEKNYKEESVDLTGLNILLVEDNEFNKEIAEVLLSDVGAIVTTADNGRIATEIFKNSELNAFDIILMDLMMPELDGCEATKLIRRMNRTDAKNIPIIAMTASAFAEEINRCKEAGMNEHIAKPLDLDILMSKLSKYYKKPL